LDKYMENEAEIFIFPQITELRGETKVGQPKCPLCYGVSNLFHEDRITRMSACEALFGDGRVKIKMPEDKLEVQWNRKHAVPGHKRDIQTSIREENKGTSA